MTIQGAVLDACVLFPAVLRDTLLRSASRGLYACWWSAEILEELRRNLVARARVSETQAQRLIGTLRYQFEDAEVSGYEHVIKSATNDPKDRHVVAAAVAARASVIVTINLRDFPAPALLPFGVKAQSPDVFLTDLFRAQPEMMTDIVARQAAALHRPPMAIDDVLGKLAIFAPTFADLVRAEQARADRLR